MTQSRGTAPGSGPVSRIGLATLVLAADEAHPLEFTRSGPGQYFMLTVTTSDTEEVSVYEMTGTIGVTVSGDEVSIDRIALTGELRAGLDRGELNLTSSEPFVGRLLLDTESGPGEDTHYSGDFVAEGTLEYSDGLNNADSLYGARAAELSGVRVEGRILDADHVLMSFCGNAALLSRAESGPAMATVCV